MVYMAAGISGLTAIVGTFFVKDHFGFPAAFLASLTFWAGIPWALKMPLGHLVDLIWRWKAALVWLGAALLALSIGIMYGLIAYREAMAGVMTAEGWYVLSVVLAPIGYVLQDVVADAMTVEAVPAVDDQGRPYSEEATKAMHTTMQTLGRVAIIGGTVMVALVNIVLFSGTEALTGSARAAIYAQVYLLALIIPALSVLGVILASVIRRSRVARLRAASEAGTTGPLEAQGEPTRANWWILGGGLAFAVVSVGLGIAGIPYGQEIIFAGSLAVVLFLMRQLLGELSPALRHPLVGTAIVIFVFRATPLPGPGVEWWQIDVLGFDERFFSLLSLITAGLTLAGMLVLRPLIARRTIVDVVLLLTLAAGLLSLPLIGLAYGLHEWTSRLSGGVVDARFIALVNTALESPLGQVSMIPMLAWIAKNAPAHLKATFFAVMASFTNLALAAGSLGTKYLNQILVVTREVRDRTSGAVVVAADYGDLGWLLIATTALAVALPLLAIFLVQASRFRTAE
ncbi:MAG: folate/biopterin family MFS transporter [Alphaproteobacteria bacterium]|nr:folate/biopterin family MFS transporter [Alphaproteobacteria bacterium]